MTDLTLNQMKKAQLGSLLNTSLKLIIKHNKIIKICFTLILFYYFWDIRSVQTVCEQRNTKI